MADQALYQRNDDTKRNVDVRIGDTIENWMLNQINEQMFYILG